VLVSASRAARLVVGGLLSLGWGIVALTCGPTWFEAFNLLFIMRMLRVLCWNRGAFTGAARLLAAFDRLFRTLRSLCWGRDAFTGSAAILTAFNRPFILRTLRSFCWRRGAFTGSAAILAAFDRLFRTVRSLCWRRGAFTGAATLFAAFKRLLLLRTLRSLCWRRDAFTGAASLLSASNCLLTLRTLRRVCGRRTAFPDGPLRAASNRLLPFLGSGRYSPTLIITKDDVAFSRSIKERSRSETGSLTDSRAARRLPDLGARRCKSTYRSRSRFWVASFIQSTFISAPKWKYQMITLSLGI